MMSQIPVSKSDRRRAKNTAFIFGAITFIFAILAMIFGVLTPQVSSADDYRGEKITALHPGKDDTSYFVSSDKNIGRCRFEDDAEISDFSFSDIAAMVQADGLLNQALPNSFEQFGLASYVDTSSSDFFYVFDANGNAFKLLDDGTSLTVSSDYYLRKSKSKVQSVINDGDKIFVIAQNANAQFQLELYDAQNLKNGPSKSKVLWDINLEQTAVGSTAISPLSAGTVIWDVSIQGDYLYILEAGGFIKVHESLLDTNGAYGPLDYFGSAEAFYEEYLRTALRGLSDEVKTKNGLSEETIAACNVTELESYYVALTRYTVVEAKEAAGEAFAEANDWVTSYDALKQTMLVKDDAFDNSLYSILYCGNLNIGGAVYSPKKETFYLGDNLTNSLYTITAKQVQEANFGTSLSALATPLSSLSFEGKKLSIQNYCVRYNRFADTLYVLFANSSQVALVSLEGDCSVLSTFSAAYDISTIIGNQSNRRFISLSHVTTVDGKGRSDNHLRLSRLDPERFVHRNAFLSSAITFGALGCLSLIGVVLSFLAVKRTHSLAKAKLIFRDLKKHKWIYVALIPFVALLILFCYYEAIGSIALSFFSYTRDKPTWIWNNFGNYLKVFNESNFWLSVGNTIFFLIADLILGIVPPLIFAFILTLIRSKKYSSFVRTMMYIPGIIPGIASMLIWRVGIFGDYGVLNNIVHFFHGETVQWLANGDISRYSLILMGFPFVSGYLLFYGGLMNVPKEYYEACDLEGMSVFKRFFRIDLPLIKPQLKYVFVTIFISSVQNYARTYMLKSSGTTTVVENMYITMTSSGADYGMASAYATLIFVFLAAAIVTNFRTQKSETLGREL